MLIKCKEYMMMCEHRRGMSQTGLDFYYLTREYEYEMRE